VIELLRLPSALGLAPAGADPDVKCFLPPSGTLALGQCPVPAIPLPLATLYSSWEPHGTQRIGSVSRPAGSVGHDLATSGNELRVDSGLASFSTCRLEHGQFNLNRR
jgi:hypothetical protein